MKLSAAPQHILLSCHTKSALSSVCRTTQIYDALSCLQETGSVKEENHMLREQLLDIQASLAQLTTSNHVTLREAEVCTCMAAHCHACCLGPKLLPWAQIAVSGPNCCLGPKLLPVTYAAHPMCCLSACASESLFCILLATMQACTCVNTSNLSVQCSLLVVPCSAFD